MLACNGIIINENYKSDTFKYPRIKEEADENVYYKYRVSNLISQKPSVVVEDKEGIFPLKLDRNELDSDEFPFEDQLLEEVSKLFLAKLLTLEIDVKKLKLIDKIHNESILYTKDGYIIDSNYFIDNIKQGCNLIRIIVNTDHIKVPLDILNNSFVYIQFEEKIKLSYQESNVFPFKGGRVILKKNKFDELFNSSIKRLPRFIKDNIIVEFQDVKHVIYRTSDFNSSSLILSDTLRINSSFLNDDVDSIQEITNEYFKIKTHPVTHSVFRKYIKENYIIPYDLNERKKIYTEAFNELKIFM